MMPAKIMVWSERQQEHITIPTKAEDSWETYQRMCREREPYGGSFKGTCIKCSAWLFDGDTTCTVCGKEV